MLPDTHAHLADPAFHDDLDAVLLRARQAGVDRILAVGSDADSSKRAVVIAQEHEPVYAAVGIHPHEASHFEQQADMLQSLLAEDKVVAVGEIGLDYVRGAPREAQLRAFRQQLTWAAGADLPVSVHNRDADGDVLHELQASEVRAVLHCFSGSQAHAERALEAGYFLSFAGNLTFPRADRLRAVAAAVPLDRVLVETDSPVLAPQPWRGRRNEPARVVATAEVLAGLLGVAPDPVAESVSRNADRVFLWRGR